MARFSVTPRAIAALQARAVAAWHRNRGVKVRGAFETLVLAQHRFNYDLWHQEDQARRRDVPDSTIARVKRAIDGLNQKRNDSIEQIDFSLLRETERRGIHPRPGASFNTETPGGAVDRLSILALRIYHMRQEAARRGADAGHRIKCMDRLRIMKIQQSDLVQSLTILFRDIFKGMKRIKVYRQFKMYNDPALNPAIYRKSQSR